MWGIKIAFRSRKKILDLDENSVLGDFSKFNTHSKNAVGIGLDLVLSMVNEAFLNFVQLTKCGESSCLSIAGKKFLI